MQALQEAQQRFNDLVNSDWPERVPVDALEDYDPAFMKEGFLQKKGQRLKGWKRRWFVCDGRALSYYISRKDRKPNAVIPLEGCTVQDGGISETWNSPRIYLTDGATGVMYCLSAEDGTAVTQWLAVLRNAVARVNGELEDGQLGDGGANGRARGGDDGRPNYTRSVSIDSKATNVGGGAAAPGPRTTTLRSAVSAGAAETKRTARLASAPPTSSGPTTSASAGVSASAAVSGAGANASTVASRPHRGKTQHVATSVALENELSSGLDLLDVLLAGRHTLSSRSPVAFRPISARDGVLRSVGVDSRTGKTVARASVVLPVASEIAAFLITDHSRRGEWDVHFPVAAHVASFDDATDLVYLAAPSAQVTSTRPFVAPPAAAAIGALGAALLVYTTSTWPELLTTMAIAGALGALVNALDLAALTAPRDLLLLRHVRETATKDDVPNEGDELGQSVVTILEKSVVNELKPAVSSVVRAHVSLSGWRLEPVDGTRTVATFVTEVDLKGWVSPTTSAQFAIERLEAVDVLREFVSQAQLRGGAALGFDEEGSTMGRDDRAVTELTDDEFGGDGELEEGLAEGGEGHHSFHPRVYIRGMMEMPTGGLKLVDKEIAKKQGGVVKDVIKSFGAKILEGKSAVSLSLPVRIFEPRTNLERLCDLMLYAPTYLNRAADSSDPVERLKLVIAFAVAGLHHSVGQLKPFNPILGETYQTTLNDGTDVCCEHTSHHPPISNFQLTGNKYSLAGYVLWHGSFSMKSNAVINSNRGPIRVSFGDGTTVQYNLPYLQLGGMLWGDRTVEIMGPMLFEDKKHHLMCELKLNPDAKQGMGGMFSTPKTPSDHFRGAIINTQTGAEICDVSGSWLHDVRCGGQQYWSIKRDKSGFLVPYPEAKLLPSDSRFREDRKFLDEGDLDESQEWKVRLEVLQRADRKIRIDGRRPNHWSFKDGAGAGGAH